MKRIFAVLLALGLLLLAACSKGVSPRSRPRPSLPRRLRPELGNRGPNGAFADRACHGAVAARGERPVHCDLCPRAGRHARLRRGVGTAAGRGHKHRLGAADARRSGLDGSHAGRNGTCRPQGRLRLSADDRAGRKGWYYDEFTVDTAQTGELAVQYDGDALAASIRAAEQNGVRYAVSDVNLKDSVYGGVELTGRIRNDTAERAAPICVAAVLLTSRKSRSAWSTPCWAARSR